MENNFERALVHVLHWEGGFTNHMLDPGGPTNLGVTKRTLERWRGRPVGIAEIMDLKVDDVRPIYRTLYWKNIKGDRLPPGVDLAVFDAAVNQGVKRAAKFLQGALAVKTDGDIGPITLNDRPKPGLVSGERGKRDAPRRA